MSGSDYFMVSYDVCSLFTNIPLDETIDLEVDIIFDNNKGMSIAKQQLKKLFVFATCFFYKHIKFSDEARLCLSYHKIKAGVMLTVCLLQ